MLEVGAAGLAAERATGEHMAGMADELTGMFATLDEPQVFLRHDLGFHRAVAAGSGNPIVAAIIGTLTEIIWETGRINMSGFSLRESAETHRRIYDAIRSRSAERGPARDDRAPRARALGAGEAGDGRGPQAQPPQPLRPPSPLLRDVVVGPQLVLDVDRGVLQQPDSSPPRPAAPARSHEWRRPTAGGCSSRRGRSRAVVPTHVPPPALRVHSRVVTPIQPA